VFPSLDPPPPRTVLPHSATPTSTATPPVPDLTSTGPCIWRVCGTNLTVRSRLQWLQGLDAGSLRDALAGAHELLARIALGDGPSSVPNVRAHRLAGSVGATDPGPARCPSLTSSATRNSSAMPITVGRSRGLRAYRVDVWRTGLLDGASVTWATPESSREVARRCLVPNCDTHAVRRTGGRPHPRRPR